MFALTAVIIPIVLAAASALCGPRAQVATNLALNFNETAVAMGERDSKNAAVLYVSPEGTWTIVLTGSDGVSCAVDSGVSWTTLDELRGPKT